jgi:putative DNA primase/helicase
MRTQPMYEEEWRKAITAALIELPTALIFDNLTGPISSAALSSVLTADIWTDRLLGLSTIVKVAVKAMFMATANNVQLSGELSRRSVPIRIDAKTERPWQREGEFKHPLPLWAVRHRAELVAALLTIWAAWLAEGRPVGDRTLGSYESWAEVMGGVLHVAGIQGFLQNLDKLYERADTETAAHKEFINAWWDRHGEKKQPSSNLVALAENAGIPLGASESQHIAALGTFLCTLRSRRYKVFDDNTDNYITVMVTSTPGRKGKNFWSVAQV